MVAIFTGAGVGFDRGSGSVLGSLGLLGSSTLGRSGEQLLFNAATGNLMVSQRDEYLVGLGLDASVARTYNSRGDLSDENGDNWRHGYDRRIVNHVAGVSVQRVSGDGSVITYTYDGSKYVATDGAGAYDTLTFNSSARVWTWTDGDSQVREIYNEAGVSGSGSWNLAQQIDTDNNTINFSYYADGKLYQVTTAGSGFGVSTLTYSWSGNNLSSVITGYWDLSVDPNNPTYRTLTRTSYTYETYDTNKSRLKTVRIDYTPDDNVVDTNGNGTIEAGEGYVTTYSYDGNSTRITQIAQSDGSQVDVVYETNGSGKVWKLIETASTNVTRTTEFTYGAGFTEIKDPLNLVTRLEYDASNQLTRITLPVDRPGGDQQIIEFAYNGTGDVLSVTTKSYNQTTTVTQTTGSTSYTYGDPANPSPTDNGLAHTITDREGNVVTRTYGTKNQLLTETTTSSDADGPATAHTVRFVYDSENHLRYRISASGEVTEYRYTSSGLLQYTIAFPEHPYTGTDLSSLPYDQWLAAVDSWESLIPDESSIELSQLTYDVRGNITQDRRFSIATPTGGATSAEGKLYTFFTYDQAGKLLFRNVDNRNTETFVYDGIGRVTSAVDVNGATTTYVFNDAATTTTVTLATGLRQVSVYNKAGELISFTEQAVTPTSLQESVGPAQYKYDADGRLRWQMDATGRKTYFVYDQLGRKVADVAANGDVIEYRYDVSNRLVATIAHGNRLASTTALEDENGVVNLATFFPASSTSDLWTWHIYDKEGRLLQSIAGDGSTSIMTYDGLGRLVSSVSYYTKLAVAGYKSNNLPTTVVTPASHAKDRVSRSFYDKDGRLIGQLDGEGYLSQFVYDKAGRKTQETRFWKATAATTTERATWSFNQLLGSVVLDSARDRTTRYVYNGQGQLRFVIDAMLHVTEMQYDVSGSGTAIIVYTNTLDGSITDFTYDYVKGPNGVGAAGFASATDRKTFSVYDSAGRVAYSINSEGAVTSYAYNSAGQVTKETQFKNARVTTALPSQATMDTWVAGNADPANDRVTRFYYDGVGVLRYTIDGEGYVTRHDYDAEGRATQTWTYANKITVGDSATTSNVYSLLPADTDPSIAKTVTAYDALGRVETVTDAEGSITRFAYNANGLVWQKTLAWSTSDASVTSFWYDGAGRVTSVRDAENFVTETTYTAFGEASRVTRRYNKASGSEGAGTAPVISADSRDVASYSYYNQRGLLISTRDPENYVVETGYTAFGEVDIVTRRYTKATGTPSLDTPPTIGIHAEDALTSYTYDKRGLTIAVRDAEDYVTETSYTAFGQVQSVTRRYNKATGARVSGTVPNVTPDAARDAVTSFEYDRRGLVTKTTDAEGYFEIYTLNAFGQRVQVQSKSYGVDGSGNRLTGGIITNEYDRRGLLVKETLPMISWNANGTIQASSVINRFEYDARGNRTRMIEADNVAEKRTTIYEYDKVNRLTAKKLDAVATVSYSGNFISNNTVTVTTTGSVVPTESYVYDPLGRLKQVTDALGGRTVYFYDKLGRKTDEVRMTDAVLVQGSLTHWTYDADGTVRTKVYGDLVAVPAATATTPPAGTANYRETVSTYDKLGRLTGTSIANVLTGSWNGSTGATTSIVTVATALEYDAYGNVIKATDANGYATYSYYDRAGRKTTQVDALNFVTKWDYDSEGNVKRETRYATALPATPNTATEPTAPASTADDRITDFTYDKNGHRLTETRSGVKIATIDPVTWAFAETFVSSTIIYTYNGLGQVLSKQEATGDKVAYSYDATGRLTKESRAAYTDHASASVTPTVDYLYNGLNNLARTRQGGATTQAGDRITTYTYGAGGRLLSITDPAGGTHTYDYDAAGNIVRDSYTRLKSDGTTSLNEGILYRRDILGRVVAQAIATKVSATSWTSGDGQNTEYNVYGDVSRRGINGLTQETFTYNNRGLVEKTNSGDGVWRFFVYDKNGNKTLTIEDEHYLAADLGTKSLADVLGYLGATAGATFVDGLNVSVATYDQRNMGQSSFLTQRELKTGDPRYTIASNQTYNAFGEVATQTRAYRLSVDTAPEATLFTYNTMGRLIKKELPTVSWTNEAGTVAQARPTELYHYDRSGRLIASHDANGNLLRRTLLAGSGYGEAEALVAAELHADTGIARTFHDVFGDARILRNELNYDETRSYDAMGRLITQVHRGGLLTDNYVYDILGQRTRHWNSFFGSGTVETTDYDLQGRVVSTKDYAGDITTNSYAWSDTVATALGTTGGWTQTTSQWGKSKSQTSDIFGNATSETDFGNHTKTNTYDKAGRLDFVSGSNGTYTTTLDYSYFNTGLASQVVDVAGTGLNTITATFAYDANGLRTAEKYAGTVYRSISTSSYASYTSSAQTLQDATITYDALGRISDISSTATSGSTTYHQEFDLNGNIMKTSTIYPNLVSGGTKTENDSFRYDAMNRVVMTDNAATAINTLPGGSTISYDVAGNRKTTTTVRTTININGGGGSTTTTLLTYNYDAVGNFVGSTRQDNGGTIHPQVTVTRDALGRITRYTENLASTVYQDRYNISYNARGQVTDEWSSQKKGADIFLNKVTNTYNAADGTLISNVSDNYKNGSDSGAQDTSLTNTYAWYDIGKVSVTNYDRDTGDSGNSIYTSTYTYDGLGRLQRVRIADGLPKTVHFALTADEQILSRVENEGGSANPVTHRLFVAGAQLAEYTTNDLYDEKYTNYNDATAMHAEIQGTGRFRYGRTTGTAGSHTHSGGFTEMNSNTTGAYTNATGYTVRSGDTLSGIAAQIWGDSSQWYRLAEANGLSGDAALVEGQSLRIPFGNIQSKNNASTFRPYDPAHATGDTSPTSRKPPKNKKCGMFGQLLLMAIAIAVTVIIKVPVTNFFTSLFAGSAAAGSAAAAAAATAGSIVGAATTGAIASAVSQGVGVATGIQDKFSWKGVATAALAAGISAGIGPGGVFGKAGLFGANVNGTVVGGALGKIGSETVRAGLYAATGSALSQGVGVVTGLQKKFDWVGVAAAGIAAGIESLVSQNIAGGLGETYRAINGDDMVRLKPTFGHSLTVGMAGGIAEAATRSIATGTSFGDNLIAVLPDVIGRTIGNTLGEAVVTEDEVVETAGERQAREQQEAYAASAPNEPFTPTPLNFEPSVASDLAAMAKAFPGGEATVQQISWDGDDFEFEGITLPTLKNIWHTFMGPDRPGITIGPDATTRKPAATDGDQPVIAGGGAKISAANPVTDNEGYELVRQILVVKGDQSYVFVGSSKDIKVVSEPTGHLDAKAPGKLARKVLGPLAFVPSRDGAFSVQVYDTYSSGGVIKYGHKMGQFDVFTKTFDATTTRYEISAGRSNSLRVYGHGLTDPTYVSIWVKR